MVPEVGTPAIREVFVHRYRLIYEISGSEIEILRHWRGRVDVGVLCYTPAEIEERRRDIGIIAQALKEGRRI